MRRTCRLVLAVGVVFALGSCASRPAGAPPNLSHRIVDAGRLPLSVVMRSYFRRYPIETTDFEPSMLGPEFAEHSHDVSEKFDYPQAPRALFDRWMALPPTEMWDGPSSYFALLLVPAGQGYRVYDRLSRTFPPLRPGMLVFLLLKVDISLEIPVAFEITRVDDTHLVFQLTYLQQNASHGVQTLTFRPHDGGTTVIHDSRYASASPLRNVLYPIFHRRLVSDFHHALEERFEK